MIKIIQDLEINFDNFYLERVINKYYCETYILGSYLNK